MLSKFFLDRPVFAWVIAIVLMAAGVLAIYSFVLPFIVGGALSLVGAWAVYQYVPETVMRADQ